MAGAAAATVSIAAARMVTIFFIIFVFPPMFCLTPFSCIFCSLWIPVPLPGGWRSVKAAALAGYLKELAVGYRRLFTSYSILFLFSPLSEICISLSLGHKKRKAQIKCSTAAWLLIRAFRFLTRSEQQSTQQISQNVVKALFLRLKLHLFKLLDPADSPLAEVDLEGTGELALFQVLQDIEELVEFVVLVHYCFHQHG